MQPASTIDPNAPWWANLIVLLIVALIPTGFAVRAKHAAKQSVTVAEESHAETTKELKEQTEKLDVVVEQVQNSHAKGLRDDLDDKVNVLAEALAQLADASVQLTNSVEGVRRDIGGLHSDVRDARVDIGYVHKDIDGIRTEARRDRRRIGSVERQVSTALGKAQDLLDLHHPGGTDLLEGMAEDPPDRG